MACIKKLFLLLALALIPLLAFAKDWNDFYSQVVDDLIYECIFSPRIAEYTQYLGVRPTVIVGYIENDTYEDIDTSLIARKFQTAVINTGVLEFVATSEERQGLRGEKWDQELHATPQTAKPMDREYGADLMMIGKVSSVQGEKSITYYVSIRLVDIEQNFFIFASEKSFQMKTKKAKREKIREEAGSDEYSNHFKTYSFCVPVMSRKFEGDDGEAECSFEAVGMGYDYSSHKRIDASPFVTHIRAGFATSGIFATLIETDSGRMGGGTLTADYGGNKAELDHIFDLMTYLRLGLGMTIVGGRDTWLLIPTAGVGSSFNVRYGYNDDANFYGPEITLDVFANLLWLCALDGRVFFGLSLEVSSPVCGAGKFSELGSYYVDPFSTLNFLPTLVLLYRHF